LGPRSLDQTAAGLAPQMGHLIMKLCALAGNRVLEDILIDVLLEIDDSGCSLRLRSGSCVA